MVFSSATFLYLFLPIALLMYYLAPTRFKNTVLLVASMFFYAFGEPVYVSLLLFSSVCDYLCSSYIESHRGEIGAKFALMTSVVVNLGMLGFFKYADFGINTINSVFGTAIPLFEIALPIGISFFTFQTMSYTIDVYRGRFHAQRNFGTMMTFVCLFPQLIAGPIVRYSDIERELDSRKVGWEDMGYGIRRFVIGLGKKVLIANAMGELCAYYPDSSEKSILFARLYAVAFTLQIYFDFSGYSDMAIGLGRMFGFHFPENFDYPYLSKSITEFWRRWHMTLGSWFRDYVYIPLGGNRTDRRWKWIRNLLIVWLLTGLWHGAAWNFVLWGGFFGVLLMVEKLWLKPLLDKLPGVVQHVYVLLLVIISFVIFNATGVADAGAVLGQMFGVGSDSLAGTESLYLLRSYGVLLVLAVLGATRLPKKAGLWISERKISLIVEPIVLAGLLCLVTASIVDGSFNPFLYFRF